MFRGAAKGLPVNIYTVFLAYTQFTGCNATCSLLPFFTGQAAECHSTHRDRYQSEGNAANVISRRAQLMMHGDGQRTLRELV